MPKLLKHDSASGSVTSLLFPLVPGLAGERPGMAVARADLRLDRESCTFYSSNRPRSFVIHLTSVTAALWGTGRTMYIH